MPLQSHSHYEVLFTVRIRIIDMWTGVPACCVLTLSLYVCVCYDGGRTHNYICTLRLYMYEGVLGGGVYSLEKFSFLSSLNITVENSTPSYCQTKNFLLCDFLKQTNISLAFGHGYILYKPCTGLELGAARWFCAQQLLDPSGLILNSGTFLCRVHSTQL